MIQLDFFVTRNPLILSQVFGRGDRLPSGHAPFRAKTYQASSEKFFDTFCLRTSHETIKTEKNAMKTYFEFACLHCGQHMECEPRFCGSQMRCTACGRPIVIPMMRRPQASDRPLILKDSWDTQVPTPRVESPIRYRERNSTKQSVAKVNA